MSENIEQSNSESEKQRLCFNKKRVNRYIFKDYSWQDVGCDQNSESHSLQKGQGGASEGPCTDGETQGHCQIFLVKQSYIYKFTLFLENNQTPYDFILSKLLKVVNSWSSFKSQLITVVY